MHPKPNKYDLPPINLYNFWIYNSYIRKLDDETIYKQYIDWKNEESSVFRRCSNFDVESYLKNKHDEIK